MSPYLQLLATLFVVFRKIRLEGLLAITPDIEHPESSEVFNCFGPVAAQHAVAYTMVRDTLQLMSEGCLDTVELDRYLSRYQASTGGTCAQQALMRAAAEALLSTAAGNPPHIAVEFGRVCVPAARRPGRGQLNRIFRELRQDLAPRGGAEALPQLTLVRRRR